MPIDYHIVADEGVILTTVRGRATLAELRSYAASTVSHRSYSAELVELIDTRGMTDVADASATFDAAFVVAQCIASPRVRARAIVAPAGALAEIARAYARQVAERGIVVRVFSEFAAAASWARSFAHWSVRGATLA